MMTTDQETLFQRLAPSVDALGCQLLGIEIQGGIRRKTVRLYIDKPQGITIEDCESVSHQVGAVLAVEDVIRGSYVLEVSSPGLDRPLFKREDFANFVGQSLRLKFRGEADGRKGATGVLVEVGEEGILLRASADNVQSIPWGAIHQARLVPVYPLGQNAQKPGRRKK